MITELTSKREKRARARLKYKKAAIINTTLYTQRFLYTTPIHSKSLIGTYKVPIHIALHCSATEHVSRHTAKLPCARGQTMSSE
jgi:hypothetical protein